MAGSAVVGYLKAILSLDSAEFESGMKQVSQSAKTWTKDLRQMGSQATAIGSSLTKTITLPIVGVGYAAVEAGAAFEQTMNQVAAVTNASADDMKKLSDAATEWGAKTKFSNREAAEAMLELGKAGFTADQTIAALPSTLQLATAANMNLGEAAAMTSNVMNTFGHSTKDLAHDNDILTEAANRSTIDVGDLRETLKFVGPVARAAGVSLSDVAAASASLGSAGIKADMAGTGLRGMLTKILAPTRSTVQALEELGYTSKEINSRQIEWTDVLDRLHVKIEQGGAVADRYTGLIMSGFGQRAGPAVIAMAQSGGEAIRQLSSELDASEGSAARMSDAFMKGLPGAMEVAKGSMETMFASIETTFAPTLEKLLLAVAKIASFVADTVVPAFNSLPEPVKIAGVVFVGLAAAIGPVIFVIGQLLTAASTITAAFTTTGIATTALSAVLPVLGSAFAVLTGPIGLVLAAIVGLGAAWIAWGDDITRVVSETYKAVKTYLWDKLEPVLTPIIGLLESIGEMFEAFAKLVGAVVEKVYDVTKTWIVDKLTPIWEGLVTTVKAVYDGIKRWLDKIPDSLLPLLGPIGAVVFAFRHWDEIVRIAQAVYTGVKTWLLDKFTDIVNGIKGKIDAITGFFNSMYEKVVGHSIVPDMIALIGENFAALQQVMVEPAKGAAALVVGAFDEMHSQVGGYISGFISSVSEGLDGLKRYAGDFALGFVSTMADILVPGLGTVVSLAWSAIQKGLAAMWRGLQRWWNDLKEMFRFYPDDYDGSFEAVKARWERDHPGWTWGDPNFNADDPNAMPTPGFDGMASGGVVRPRSGGTWMRLGEAGYPETVIPGDWSRLANMGMPSWQPAAAAMGHIGSVSSPAHGGGTIVVKTYLDGRQVAEATVPHLPRAVKHLGLA